MPPSSHSSPASRSLSPQDTGPAQTPPAPASISHANEHPSPGTRLPSSHSSPTSVMPLPQPKLGHCAVLCDDQIFLMMSGEPQLTEQLGRKGADGLLGRKKRQIFPAGHAQLPGDPGPDTTVPMSILPPAPVPHCTYVTPSAMTAQPRAGHASFELNSITQVELFSQSVSCCWQSPKRAGIGKGGRTGTAQDPLLHASPEQQSPSDPQLPPLGIHPVGMMQFPPQHMLSLVQEPPVFTQEVGPAQMPG